MENLNISLTEISKEIRGKIKCGISMTAMMVGHKNIDVYTDLLPSYFFTLQDIFIDISSMFDNYRALITSGLEN